MYARLDSLAGGEKRSTEFIYFTVCVGQTVARLSIVAVVAQHRGDRGREEVAMQILLYK